MFIKNVLVCKTTKQWAVTRLYCVFCKQNMLYVSKTYNRHGSRPGLIFCSPPPNVKSTWRSRLSITVYASTFNLMRKSRMMTKSPEVRAKSNRSLKYRSTFYNWFYFVARCWEGSESYILNSLYSYVSVWSFGVGVTLDILCLLGNCCVIAEYDQAT